MSSTAAFVVRLWLADRPGALGEVASAIGSVGGDVVGIDIVERGAGRAIDELVVELGDERVVPSLVSAVSALDGVDVESVRPSSDALHDPRLGAFEAVAAVVGASTPQDLARALVDEAGAILGAPWCALVSLQDDDVIAIQGEAPSRGWLKAFLAGSQVARGSGQASKVDDVVWAPLPGVGLALVTGRPGSPFRARERRLVAALARIGGTRLAEVQRAVSLARHPAGRR